MAYVGIVTYNSRAVVTHGLTRVSRDMSSRQRLSDSVPDTGNKLSETSLGCVRCGVRTAMDQVLRSQEAGGHVILISANDDQESLSSLDVDTLTENIKYYNIRLSSVVLHMSGHVSPHYQHLATMSGGVATSVRVADDSVWTLAGLSTNLLAAVKLDSGPGARLPETIHQVSGHYNAVNTGQDWISEVSDRDL